MIQRFTAGRMLRFGYRFHSFAANARLFQSAVTAIEEFVAATPEPILRGPAPSHRCPGSRPRYRAGRRS